MLAPASPAVAAATAASTKLPAHSLLSLSLSYPSLVLSSVVSHAEDDLILRVSKLLALAITAVPVFIQKSSLLLLLRGVGACVRVFLDIWCIDVSLFLKS
jgi:hypothetical protein